MKVNYHEKEKCLDIWLTQDDQRDEETMAKVDQLYGWAKENKWFTVVYRSGTQDLFEGTLDLLLHNKRLQAEQMRTSAPPASPSRSR